VIKNREVFIQKLSEKYIQKSFDPIQKSPVGIQKLPGNRKSEIT
jgi:hypothetical protein